MSSNKIIYYCRECILKSGNKLKQPQGRTKSMFSISSNKPEDYAGILSGESLDLCPGCGNKLTPVPNMSFNDMFNFCEYGNNDPGFVATMFDLYTNDIIKYTNQMNIITAKAEEELDKRYNEYLAQQNAKQQEVNTRHCPKCNGTNFTPVRKKYGLFMGFATNKVELVCNNCGYRMKAEN